MEYIGIRGARIVHATPIAGNDFRKGIVSVRITGDRVDSYMLFNPAFRSIPIVTLTCLSSTDQNLHAAIKQVSASRCDFSVWNNGDDPLSENIVVQWFAVEPTDDAQENCQGGS